MRKLFSVIILILIIFSFAVSLVSVSAENKEIEVNVVVSDDNLNNSVNISIDRVDSSNSGDSLQAGATDEDKEALVKQNEINSSFSNSFSELLSFKSNDSWILPLVLLGIILLLILIYKLGCRHVKKVRKKKAVKLR